MYYIYPIPDEILEVLEVIENDEFWIDELTRMQKKTIVNFDTLKN